MSPPPESRDVQVTVRARPLLARELKERCQSAFKFDEKEAMVICPTNGNRFYYNHLFAENSTQDDLYKTIALPMLDKSLEGYNCTILAYGQTGSGKTYTMGLEDVTKDNPGIIPRLVRDLFAAGTDDQHHMMEVQCSYLELYNDKIKDLLVQNAAGDAGLTIRETKDGDIYVQGLSKELANSVNEALEVLEKGNQSRSVGATEMNLTSSRSHACFTLFIRRWAIGEEAAATTSKFNLVDLAGSERLNRTKAEGARMREGIKINGGLLALGNVISKLSDKSSNAHVPYRNSKLTRLLQDSLGGNAYTSMIACISPADFNLDESISTLRYAERAKKISNRVRINIDETQAMILALKARVKELEDMVAQSPEMRAESNFETERQRMKDGMVKLEVALANSRNNEDQAVQRSRRFLSYLAECRRRAQVFESQFGRLMRHHLEQEEISIAFSTEEAHNEEFREMLTSLQQLQKLLFSLNCADPVKHVTQDVTNLFDSMLESASMKHSGVSPGKIANIMPTITESEAHVTTIASSSDVFFTGSEGSKGMNVVTLAVPGGVPGAPMSASTPRNSTVPEDLTVPPSPKKPRVETVETAINTSLEYGMADVLKLRVADLEKQLTNAKEANQKKRLVAEQQRLKLRTVEMHLKEMQNREQKLQAILNKTERERKIGQKQAEEASKLKLIRVGLLRDMKNNDNRWRLELKEKNKVISQLTRKETKTKTLVSKITRDLEKQKMISIRKTEEASRCIKRLHVIQKNNLRPRTRHQRRKKLFCESEFQKHLNQLKELMCVDKIIQQLQEVRRTNGEQLDEIKNSTFAKEDEYFVHCEERRLQEEIEKVSAQIMELKSSVARMESVDSLENQVIDMATTAEEKDTLIRWLLSEHKKGDVDVPMNMNVEHSVFKERCVQLENNLEEIERDVGTIAEGYWMPSTPATKTKPRPHHRANTPERVRFQSTLTHVTQLAEHDTEEEHKDLVPKGASSPKKAHQKPPIPRIVHNKENEKPEATPQPERRHIIREIEEKRKAREKMYADGNKAKREDPNFDRNVILQLNKQLGFDDKFCAIPESPPNTSALITPASVQSLPKSPLTTARTTGDNLNGGAKRKIPGSPMYASDMKFPEQKDSPNRRILLDIQAQREARAKHMREMNELSKKDPKALLERIRKDAGIKKFS